MSGFRFPETDDMNYCISGSKGFLTSRQQSGDRGRIPEAETGSLQQESKNVVVDNNFVG